MWFAVIASLCCVKSHMDCHTLDPNPSHVSPYRSEFFTHSTIARLDPTTSVARSRRGTADENEPILVFTIDPYTLTAHEQHAAAMVYRLFLLLYTSPREDAVDNITIVGSRATIAASGGGVVVGTASYGDQLITMYTANIPNTDGFMLVLIHEVLHLLGFGALASDGATSFIARTNALTLEFDAPEIAHCVEQYMGAGTGAVVYTDASRVHWNSSNATWNNDIMLAYISFDSTAASYCTIKTVLLSRPSWIDRLCRDETDCHSGDTCQSLGRHFFSVCQKPPVSPVVKGFDAEAALLQYCIFSLVLSCIWIGILACHEQPIDIYGDGVPDLFGTH